MGPYSAGNSPDEPPADDSFITIQAIWDTGATGSVITAEVASQLNLKPTGMTMVRGAQATALASEYLVNIDFDGSERIWDRLNEQGKVLVSDWESYRRVRSRT